MGGKSKPSNDQMVQFEMQQAQQAKQQEADRQSRLATGSQAVNDIFDAGNFNDAFYNKYNQAQLDYYQPQVDTQYSQAKAKLTTDLARSGMLNSSTAGYDQGLLSNEYNANTAGVNANADTSTGALRQSILGEKTSALNQLYSTEDPTLAADTATGMVQQGQLTRPNLAPLGQLFAPIAVGAGGFATGALDNYYTSQGLRAASPNQSSMQIYNSQGG